MSRLDPSPERRTTTLTIRLSPSERKRLDRQARATGTTVSGWARKVLLGVPPRRKRGRVEREAVHQLARVGNNVNQLARAYNTSGTRATHREVTETMRQLQATLSKLVNP